MVVMSGRPPTNVLTTTTEDMQRTLPKHLVVVEIAMEDVLETVPINDESISNQAVAGATMGKVAVKAFVVAGEPIAKAGLGVGTTIAGKDCIILKVSKRVLLHHILTFQRTPVGAP